MKKLTYIIISVFIYFIYTNNVNASTCVYEPPFNAPYKYSITCKSNYNENAICTIKDEYNQLSIAAHAVKFQIDNTCPSSIYITYGQNTIITDINTTSGEAVSLNKNKSTEDNITSTEYENDSEYIEAKNKADKYCAPAETDSGYVDDTLCYESRKKMDEIKASYNNSGNSSGNISTEYEYEKDARYIEAKKEADKYCQSAEISGYSNLKAKCDEAKKKMEEIKASYNNSGNSTTPGSNDGIDLDNFCTGAVQGVFTTLGWVFFIVKIVIPILLIIFGCIDIGKAIIANKDDEIKKSAKTLAIRVIAGIIIFFVPTILNFVVKLIDDNDLYNGTFWDCTKCMLDPTDNVCSTLRGEE